MFDQIKPQNQTNQPVEDIFSTTDKPPAEAGQADQSQASSQPTPKSTPAASPPPATSFKQPVGPTQPLKSLKDINVPPPEKQKRNFLPVIFIIILLAVLAVLAYFAYAKFIGFGAQDTSNSTELTQPNLNKENENKNIDQQPVGIPEVVTTPAGEQNVNQIIDSDHDGLTDNEEDSLGTNPNEVDTDGDNLFDYEEVKTYLTDPLNPDSDNDGYLDGEEVQNGYNPLGPGKLFNV